MEYRKEDLMEAKKQILGVGENMKCTLFTGHPVRRVHFALYD